VKFTLRVLKIFWFLCGVLLTNCLFHIFFIDEICAAAVSYGTFGTFLLYKLDIAITGHTYCHV